MTALVQTIIAFISSNPHWAEVVVFVTSAAEAIVVVGGFVPGTVILVGVGVVIGLGELPLWPILASAVLGGLTGDSLSYGLGRHYRDRVGGIWPVSRNANLLARGKDLFGRHGTLSVFIGRFIPFGRMIIPLVAGAFGMAPVRFFAVTIISTLVWAPAHVLAGAALGRSVDLVREGTRDLALALMGVLILLAGAALVIHRVNNARRSNRRAAPVLAVGGSARTTATRRQPFRRQR